MHKFLCCLLAFLKYFSAPLQNSLNTKMVGTDEPLLAQQKDKQVSLKFSNIENRLWIIIP